MENLKQLTKNLEATLQSTGGFKAIHGGGFLGGRSKKSFAVWSRATERAVLPLHFIHHFLHEDDEGDKSYYGIYAFSTKGDVDPKILSHLKLKAMELDLGTVRYESGVYCLLELWRGPRGSSMREENSISEGLSDPANGLFVYAEAVGRGSNAVLDKPLVVWARLDNEDYIYPIKNRLLK